MIPLPDVRCVQRSQRDVATCLALVVEKGVQEARAEPELLEVRVDGEKCDMGVFKLVTTQITEEKADEVAFLSIDAETCTTNPLLPGVLEITDRRAVKALGENFTSGLEVGHLQRCQFEAHVAETHLVVMVVTGRAAFNFTGLYIDTKGLRFSHTKLRRRYTGYCFCSEVRCTGAGRIWDNQVGNGQSYLKDVPGSIYVGPINTVSKRGIFDSRIIQPS